jgi:hypothetical protein
MRSRRLCTCRCASRLRRRAPLTCSQVHTRPACSLSGTRVASDAWRAIRGDHAVRGGQGATMQSGAVKGRPCYAAHAPGMSPVPCSRRPADASITPPDALLTRSRSQDAVLTRSRPIDALLTRSRPLDAVLTRSRPLDALLTRSRPLDAVLTRSRPQDTLLTRSRPLDAVLTRSRPLDILLTRSRPLDAVLTRSRPLDAVLTRPPSQMPFFGDPEATLCPPPKGIGRSRTLTTLQCTRMRITCTRLPYRAPQHGVAARVFWRPSAQARVSTDGD